MKQTFGIVESKRDQLQNLTPSYGTAESDTFILRETNGIFRRFPSFEKSRRTSASLSKHTNHIELCTLKHTTIKKLYISTYSQKDMGPEFFSTHPFFQPQKVPLGAKSQEQVRLSMVFDLATSGDLLFKVGGA